MRSSAIWLIRADPPLEKKILSCRRTVLENHGYLAYSVASKRWASDEKPLVAENKIVGVMFAVIQEGINNDQMRQILHTWARHHLRELMAGVWQTWSAEPSHHWRKLVNRVNRQLGQRQILPLISAGDDVMVSGLVVGMTRSSSLYSVL